MVGRLLSYWVSVTFQGRAVKLRGCISGVLWAHSHNCFFYFRNLFWRTQWLVPLCHERSNVAVPAPWWLPREIQHLGGALKLKVNIWNFRPWKFQWLVWKEDVYLKLYIEIVPFFWGGVDIRSFFGSVYETLFFAKQNWYLLLRYDSSSTVP